ncbi:MAG: hypothetical protein NDI94_01420, partial [Candidatus Woesearchaeota archaeon]|nr:hypothetical protein [Candidatus Woesearchaeota archaeon]
MISFAYFKKKCWPYLFLGIFAVFIGFLTSLIFFRSMIGVASIFFTSLIAIPFISSLLIKEEDIEASRGKSFIERHEKIIDIFLYFFIGSFFAFFVIGLFNPNFLFGGNMENTAILRGSELEGFPKIPRPDIKSDGQPAAYINMNQVTSIFKNNLYVMLVSFLLSLLYGVGAIFVIIYNASIF